MNYTCKKCCCIFQQATQCPICHSSDEVVPIIIVNEYSFFHTNTENPSIEL